MFSEVDPKDGIGVSCQPPRELASIMYSVPIGTWHSHMGDSSRLKTVANNGVFALEESVEHSPRYNLGIRQEMDRTGL